MATKRTFKKAEKQYAWGANLPFEPKCDPTIFADELERIQKDSGVAEIKPEQLIDAAKDPSNPLHRDFEWNDSKAGHSWRLQQARALLRGLVVTIVAIKDSSPEPRRAIISVVHEDKHRSYVPILEVMQSPTLMQSVLDDARRDMNRFIARYKAYEELADVVGAMEKALTKLRPSKPAGEASP